MKKTAVAKILTVALFVCACLVCFSGCHDTTYLLRLKSDGANVDVITVSDSSDASIVMPKDPVKNGYTFGGWYYDDGTFTQPFDPASKIEQDTDVYAKWNVKSYTVTYILNDGAYPEGKSNPTEYTVESEDITLAPLERKGYAFDGWYQDGNFVGTVKKGSTGDITLSAKWVKNGYTVSYSNVKGVANDNPRTYTISDSPIKLSDLEKTGYRFDGWYRGDTKYTEIPAGSTGNLELEAKWSLVNYTISYLDAEGKSLDIEGFDLPESYTIESDRIVLNAYYLSGYRFNGWFDDDGIRVSTIEKGTYGNVVLYADLELTLFVINYNDRFNRPNENPTVAEYGEIVQLLPLKKADYDFIGWTLNGTDIIDSVEVFSDMTLAAVWKQKEGLADFDYIVDDEYVGHNKDGFVMLLGVLNPSVTELVVPECVSMLKSGLLRNCNSLESLTLPFLGESAQVNPMTSYLAFLFGGSGYSDNATCVPKSLKTLIINGGEVADNALFGCAYLEKLIFNDGVTRIGDSAVANCFALKELQVPFIGEKYCEDDDYNGINCALPDNARPIYIFGGRYKTNQFPKALEKLTITKGYAPDPTYYDFRDKATRFYTFSQLRNLKELDYTSENDYLYDHMFEYMAYLEKLTIRGNIKKIGFFYGYTYAADYIKELVIPDTVTEISEQAFMSFKSLPRISLPNVKVIPANAFKNCTRLSSIELCSELTSIGNEAFSGCSSLFSITIPKTVTEIGTDAFKDCTNLFEVYNYSGLSAEKGSDALGGLCKYAWDICTSEGAQSKFQNIDGCIVYEQDGEKLLMKYIGDSAQVNIPDGVTVIYTNAFADCSVVASVTMPESIKTIQDNAFDYCSNLVSVKMSNGIKSIGKNIFINCKSLTTVELPPTIETIYEGMFENCTLLANIKLPASVKTIGNRAFNKSGLTAFNFGNIVSIGEGAFEGTKFTQIDFTDSLITIGNNAFKDCSELTAIAFGSKLETIGASAFANCAKLNRVTLPNSLTTLGASTFANCAKLNQVTLPESLTTLGEKAFYECSALTSIVIPSKITAINSYAFGFCTSLSEVTLNDNLVDIGYGAFFKCKISNLKWPTKLESIGVRAFSYNCLEKVELPDSVKIVNSEAFSYNETLTELIIPKTTQELGSCIALYSFNVTKLAVPFVGGTLETGHGRISDIFGYKTDMSYNLKTLIIHGGSIIYRMTSNSTNLSTFGAPYTRNGIDYFENLTSLTLGDNIKNIEDGALSYLKNLNTLILPSAKYSTSLKKLFDGERALDVLGFSSGDVTAEYVSGITASKWLLSSDVKAPGIPSGATVLFTGTFEEWDALTFENKNTCTVYFYSPNKKQGTWRYTFHGAASPEIW